MTSSRLLTTIYRTCIWISKLAYLNLLWLFFTLTGAILLGVGPSTAGLYSVVRKWQREGIDQTRVFKTYWSTYKNDFWRANFLSWIFIITGFILYFDLRFFQSQTGVLSLLLFSLSVAASVVYIAALVYLFPIFVHFDLRFSQYIKNCILIPLLRPFDAFTALSGVIIVSYVATTNLTLLLLFSISLLGLYINWIAQRSFLKIEQKQQNNANLDKVL
jgi:uncharacterized membrane protein YesL